MALLQISEPGASPDPHQRRIAVGIDLGTTHSLVAALRHGTAECLPDDAGRVLLPSAVRYLGGGRRAIGHEALAAQALDASNTIVSSKRFMGRSLADISGHAKLPYRFVDKPGMVALATVDGEKTPVEVAAEILATLRQRAEDSFEADLFGAVITVPAYFDDAQRQATKDAAQLAGLNVLRLISEPTAAAVAYGLDHGSEGLYAVYDLGGGTFDISLLRLSRGVFEVVATGGDAALGGDDIDQALADWVLQQAGATLSTPQDRRSALVSSRAVKEALSSSGSALWHAELGGQTVEVSVTRAQLEAVAQPWVDRTLREVRRVLRDAQVNKTDVQGVVMVGGSTRMPLVRAAVSEAFGQEVLTNVNPDEVVALGAAVQADALAGNAADRELLLLDVIALSLGLETMGGLVERIVERNSTIPTAKAQEFTTFKDGQTAIALHVVQGERERVEDCRSLARFELRGIPPMVAGAARVRVTFQVDADGLLSVNARELTSGVEASVTVKPSYGLADDDIARMLREGFAHADTDMAERSLREALVEAERMSLATRAALASDGELLTPEERASIEALVAALEQQAQRPAVGGAATGTAIAAANASANAPGNAPGNAPTNAPTNASAIASANAATPGLSPQAQAHAIEAAVKTLADGTEAFAATRMNRSIRQALAGRRVEEV
jgi:molecular chaperone HscA